MKYSNYLKKVYFREDNEIFDDNILKEYFYNFIKATGLLRFTINKIKCVIDINEKIFLIDFGKSSVSEIKNFDKNEITAIIKVHKSILKSSLKNFIFSNIDISKRWNVEITRGNVQKHLYLTSFDFYL